MPEIRSNDTALGGLAMSEPRIYLWRMLLCLVLVAPLALLLSSTLQEAFLANAAINTLILGALFIGILYTFHRVLLLYPEVRWINTFRLGEPGFDVPRRTALLAPMAALLRERTGPVSLPASAMRAIMDSIGARLDEARDISRYMIGLLIFLGLLGTFWGLLQTVGAVGETIRTLPAPSGAADTMFEELRSGLEAPLAGMGTAFSSSLFGLAGSLLLGFLDLQAAQAQNRFYNDLEEWLSTVTTLNDGGRSLFDELDPEDAEGFATAFQRTARSLDNLRRTVSRNERARNKIDQKFDELSERISALVTALENGNGPAASGTSAGSSVSSEIAAQMEHLGMRLTEVAERLSALNEVGDSQRRIAEALDRAPAGLDDVALIHLRNLDDSARALLERTGENQEHFVQQLRAEIHVMAKTIAALIVEGRKGGALPERPVEAAPGYGFGPGDNGPGAGTPNT
jgi:biopolymer transport protein ExbB/TolQ